MSAKIASKLETQTQKTINMFEKGVDAFNVPERIRKGFTVKKYVEK